VDLAHVFLLTDLLDHEFQALSGFINLGTQLHTKSNLKHWASLILRHVSVKEPTTERFRFTVLMMNLLQNDSILQSREMNLLQISSISWTRRQTYQQISLVLLTWLVMNYLFMTQSHHDITSSDIVIFFTLKSTCLLMLMSQSWSFFDGRQDVLVSTDYSEYCITCARITVLLHTSFMWAYLIITKSWVLST
jgi:hypothetical protein